MFTPTEQKVRVAPLGTVPAKVAAPSLRSHLPRNPKALNYVQLPFAARII